MSEQPSLDPIFDELVEEVAEDMHGEIETPPEPAIEIDLPAPMVEVAEGEDCPFLDCTSEGTQHLHFTHEATVGTVDE